ncbi:hypothetical protein, partial [Frankia tisae]|uniref:hypothetical protein n=1 Tax=Frankia tisae TaxID=2950104 RepID=UPI0021BEE3C3
PTPPDPHVSLPAPEPSPAGSTTGSKENEGSPVPPSACGPWMLTAESLVDREVTGFGVVLDSAARHQLVTAVAERLAAGVEPGVLAEELAGEIPPGVDPAAVLLDCVRQAVPLDDVHSADATKGVADDDPLPSAGVDLVQALIDAVHEVTGQTIDRDLAGKGVAMVLRAKDGTPRAVSDPVAYLRTAVEAAPTRFLPSLIPPAVSGSRRPRWETARQQTDRALAEFAAQAAEATDGGQRLDNTGVTVVDQDGQTPEPAPTEPLSDSWTAETSPFGWMATPVSQRAPEPHVCRYSCRPGQHTYDDPESGVPTRCPIHHEHARHREAA